MQKSRQLLLLAASLFSTSLFSAEHFTDFARVVHARPVYERIYPHHDHNASSCRSGLHSPTYRKSTQKPHAKASGRVVASTQGIGANVAVSTKHRREHHVHGHSGYTAHVDRPPKRHCRHRHSRHGHRVLTGYNVTYRYHGNLFHTFTRHHPGKRLRITVSIRPQGH